MKEKLPKVTEALLDICSALLMMMLSILIGVIIYSLLFGLPQ